MIKVVNIKADQVPLINKRLALLKSKPVSIIFIHRPHCPYCKQLRPIWNNVKKTLLETQSPSNYGIFEIDKAALEKVDNKLLSVAKTVPKIIIYRQNKPLIEYDGDRTYNDLLKFSMRNLMVHDAPNKKSKKARKNLKLTRKNNHKLVGGDADSRKLKRQLFSKLLWKSPRRIYEWVRHIFGKSKKKHRKSMGVRQGPIG